MADNRENDDEKRCERAYSIWEEEGRIEGTPSRPLATSGGSARGNGTIGRCLHQGGSPLVTTGQSSTELAQWSNNSYGTAVLCFFNDLTFPPMPPSF